MDKIKDLQEIKQIQISQRSQPLDIEIQPTGKIKISGSVNPENIEAVILAMNQAAFYQQENQKTNLAFKSAETNKIHTDDLLGLCVISSLFLLVLVIATGTIVNCLQPKQTEVNYYVR